MEAEETSPSEPLAAAPLDESVIVFGESSDVVSCGFALIFIPVAGNQLVPVNRLFCVARPRGVIHR
jgi:hypothetical protein